MSIEELLKHMSPGLFVPSLQGKTKDEILVELTEAIVEGSRIKDRNIVLEMLRNREQLGSTALAKGVAFPHGRSLAVQNLTILVARSEKGVDFDSADSKPTNLFFLLLAPPQDQGNLYLQALGKIAEIIRSDDIRKRLMKCDDFESLSAVLEETAS